MPDENEGLALNQVVGSILQALTEAKHSADMESAKLIDVYKKEKSLSSFTVPAFAVSDVDVELKMAIVEPGEIEEQGEIPGLRVRISPEFIKGLDAHHISVMKFKISPVSLRIFEESK
jgi:hypothetical protein